MAGSNLTPSEQSAIHQFALAFRAGRPLDKLFEVTRAVHATHAWGTIAAQAKLLEKTINYIPENAPAEFSFGNNRSARFLTRLIREVQRTEGAEVDSGVREVADRYGVSDVRDHGEGDEPGDSEEEDEEDTVYVVFELPGGREVVVRASERCTDMGTRVWEAGLILSGGLECGRLGREVRGKRVLELGAGTGVSASGYEKAGVEVGVLTDVDEEAVENLKKNAGEGMCVRVLDLMEVDNVIALVEELKIDVVVAADVTYSPLLVEAIVEVFGNVTRKGGVGWLFVKTRSETSGSVGRRLQEEGVNVETVVEGEEWFKYLMDWDLDSVKTFRLTAAGVRY